MKIRQNNLFRVFSAFVFLISVSFLLTACGKKDEHQHHFEYFEMKQATCNENGNIVYKYCPECGKYFSLPENKEITLAETVLVVEHRLQHCERKDPNCYSDGNIEYWRCKYCDKCFTDSEAKNEVDFATVIIHSSGHTYSNEWTYDSNQHWHDATCEHTTFKTGEQSHNYEETITKNASCTENGEKTLTCTVCSYSKTATIEATGHNYVDGTCTICGDKEIKEPVGTEGLVYTLSEDKKSYELTGTYMLSDSEIIIPSTYNGLPVTKIATGLFDGYSGITSVSIPDSMISVGRSFVDCPSLNYNRYEGACYLGNDSNPYLVLMKANNVNINTCKINKNTKVIADNAFFTCGQLTSVIFEENIELITIGVKAFIACESLASITIPASVVQIGTYAFDGCTKLKNITFENTVGWFRSSIDDVDLTTAYGHVIRDVSDPSKNAKKFVEFGGEFSNYYLFRLNKDLLD